MIEKASLRTYAVGHLVLWVPNSFETRSSSNSKWILLLQKTVQKIAIANPEHAPYGRAAIAALEHFGLKGTRQRQVCARRKCKSGRTVRSVGKCTGRIDSSVAGDVSGNEVLRQVLGIAHRLLSRNTAGCRYTEPPRSTSRLRRPSSTSSLRRKAPAVLQQYGFALPARK